MTKKINDNDLKIEIDLEERILVHVSHPDYFHHIQVEQHFEEGYDVEYPHELLVNEVTEITRVAKEIFKKLANQG